MKKRIYYEVILNTKDDKVYFFVENQIREFTDLKDVKISNNTYKIFYTKKKVINFIKSNSDYGFTVFQIIKTKKRHYRKKVLKT